MEHEEFQYRDGTKGSRVKLGTRTFSSDPSCAGHGTHVAGIVGGLNYGVAKDVEIIMGNAGLSLALFVYLKSTRLCTKPFRSVEQTIVGLSLIHL